MEVTRRITNPPPPPNGTLLYRRLTPKYFVTFLSNGSLRPTHTPGWRERQVKPGFQTSGKFQSMRYFRHRLSRLMKTQPRRYPRPSQKSGTRRQNRNASDSRNAPDQIDLRHSRWSNQGRLRLSAKSGKIGKKCNPRSLGIFRANFSSRQEHKTRCSFQPRSTDPPIVQ